MDKCQHPYKKVETITYGIEVCRKCGDRIKPERITTYRISQSCVVAHGDLIKVSGLGTCKFFWIEPEPSGESVAVVGVVKGGRVQAIRNVRPNRISPAKGAVARD